MQSWIALIASAVIGSLVLVSFSRFSSDATRDMYIDTLDNATYGAMDVTARVIEYDFSRIGQGINDPAIVAFTQADSADVRYVMDSDSNGTLETMRYYVSSVAAASSTPNPNDRILYRVVNGVTETVATGVTDFRVRFFNADGLTTAVLADIRTLQVFLAIENDLGYDGEYPMVRWQSKITPPSLVTF